MGLYLHKTGEMKRTVPGKHEDARVRANDNWRPITPADVKRIQNADDPAKAAAEVYAAAGKKG